MREDCSTYRDDLAAYLVGALEGAEEAPLLAHLASCPRCAAEFDELAGLPELMAQVHPEHLDFGAEDVAFTDRVLSAAVARSRRRRWLAGVAAVLIAAFAGSGYLLAQPPPAVVRAYAAMDPVSGVQAQVGLVAQPTGTAVDITISGVPPQQRCTLVAVAVNGATDIAGTWQASYAGSAHIHGSTAFTGAQLAALRIRTAAGRLLLTVPLTRPPG